MKIIKYFSIALCILCFEPITTSALAQELNRTVPRWAVGFWRLTKDEDHGGISDVFEFRADGRWVNYTPSCDNSRGVFFVHHDDLIAMIEVPNKGPIALVFRPNSDHTKLTFTAPRTRNNAIYETVPSPSPCSVAQ